MMKAIISLLIATALLTTRVTASSDPFVGKWKLDTRHSSYPAGTCPKEMVIEMEAAGQGVRYRSQSTYANGRTTRAEYTAEYNGKQAVVVGDHGLLLPVSLKRIDAHTVVASYTRGLQVIATSRRVISSDERRMTITTKSRDQDRRNVTTFGVYERK